MVNQWTGGLWESSCTSFLWAVLPSLEIHPRNCLDKSSVVSVVSRRKFKKKINHEKHYIYYTVVSFQTFDCYGMGYQLSVLILHFSSQPIVNFEK